jgi:hypothetical protein
MKQKSASTIEALFPSGGNPATGLVIRAYLRHFDRLDIDPATVLIEPNNAVYQSEDRIVPTQPYIFPRQKLRTALANDDVTGNHSLAAELLYAQAFANAVASISNAALTFFVRHTSKTFRY